MNYQSRFMAGILRAASMLLFCAVFSPAIAQDTNLDTFGKTLKSIESELSGSQIEQETLEKWARDIAAGRPLALDCVRQGEAKLKKLTADLGSLGEPVTGEPRDVVRKRNQLKNEIKDIERDLAGCRLLVLRSEELQKRISQETKTLLARRLWAKGTNIGVLLLDNWQEPAQWLSASKDFMVRCL